MKSQLKLMLFIIAASSIAFTGCKKTASFVATTPASPVATSVDQVSVSGEAGGATQISGVGFFAETGECNSAEQGAAFAVRMTGDLAGCLYVFVDDFGCSPSGTYRESGREYFVGTYNGETGTFWTDYKFEAKYEGCAENGAALGAEIFGRCQHPVIKGSGTGVFDGVMGRMDFTDDVQAGNFPYRGHLLF